jgi:hypothetical protein
MISNFIDADGRVVVWPKKHANKDLVVAYLATKFDSGVVYDEHEVNDILKAWHTFQDWSLLRRELVERKYLSRDREGYEYRVVNRYTSLYRESTMETQGGEYDQEKNGS